MYQVKFYQPNMEAGDIAKNLLLVDDYYKLTGKQYNLVYEMKLEQKKSADALCNMFKGSLAPRNFHGHPLTSGDVVVYQSEDGTQNAYILFVDQATALTGANIGSADAAYYELQDFDASLAFDARNYVTGVLCERNRIAVAHSLSLKSADVCRLLDCTSYRVFQAPCRAEAAILCKENAFTGQRALTDMNRTLRNKDGEAVATVAGDFMICRMSYSGIQSLHPSEYADFAERHYLPESFFTFNGKLGSMAYLPKEVWED